MLLSLVSASCALTLDVRHIAVAARVPQSLSMIESFESKSWSSGGANRGESLHDGNIVVKPATRSPASVQLSGRVTPTGSASTPVAPPKEVSSVTEETVYSGSRTIVAASSATVATSAEPLPEIEVPAPAVELQIVETRATASSSATAAAAAAGTSDAVRELQGTTAEELEKRKVKELKPLLKALGLKVSGNKKELVQRLLEFKGTM